MAEKTNIPQVRFSGFDKDWEKQKFDDILEKYEDPVATPHDGYERLGVRSHVKGTFHSYVAPGAELETAQMHRVAANKLLFNITFAWEHAVAITDEDDAGKLNHDDFSGGSLVDLNRAGVPLIEIVSEPDIRSAEEAEQYLRKLKSILEYIEVSDCKMEEGSLRADINVSVHKKGEPFGQRTEMKNMNSFRSIVRAIEYESNRQIDVIEAGGKIAQETLRWDEVSGKTFSMREKENAQDYRYFPDPDLVAIKLSEEYIQNIKNSLPELPESRKKRYLEEYKLSEKDARIITSSKYLSDLFEEAGRISGNIKAVGNWIISDISRILNEKELEPMNIPFTASQLAELVMLIDKGTISSSIGKKVLEELFTISKEQMKSPKDIIEQKGWIQVSDENVIKEVVHKILEGNPKSVQEYKSGKTKVLSFLVGQAMKETKGKANPQMLNKVFIDELNNL